jgi:hypothetical protein
MPRRPAQNEPQTPPGGWRTLTHEDPEAWPKAVVFDLEYVREEGRLSGELRVESSLKATRFGTCGSM